MVLGGDQTLKKSSGPFIALLVALGASLAVVLVFRLPQILLLSAFVFAAAVLEAEQLIRARGKPAQF
jgi:hypothetical protein